MSSGRDNDLGFDHVGIHARLGVVVQGYQSPVCNDTGDSTILDDQVFSCKSVKELDVWTHEQLAEDGRRKQRCVLDDNVVLVAVIEWDTDLGQKVVAGLADDHRREELASQPGSTAGRDTLFDNGDLDIGVLAQFPRAAQALVINTNIDTVWSV